MSRTQEVGSGELASEREKEPLRIGVYVVKSQATNSGRDLSISET